MNNPEIVECGDVGLMKVELKSRNNNMELPYIPLRIAPLVKRKGPWHYSTSPDIPYSSYNHIPFCKEVLRNIMERKEDESTDFFYFAHAGHGTNSWALTHCLSFENFIFLGQYSFGGVYSSVTAKDIEDNFLKVKRLFGKALLSKHLGKLKEWENPSMKLIYISSSYILHSCVVWMDISKQDLPDIQDKRIDFTQVEEMFNITDEEWEEYEEAVNILYDTGVAPSRQKRVQN